MSKLCFLRIIYMSVSVLYNITALNIFVIGVHFTVVVVRKAVE